MAALAVMAPVGAFRVEDPGWGDPAGHALRNPSGPEGTTVMFMAYACAVAGMPQPLDSTGKSLWTLPARAGPPNVPAAPRVSAMRHGTNG